MDNSVLSKIQVFVGDSFITQIEVRDTSIMTILAHESCSDYAAMDLDFSYTGSVITFFYDRQSIGTGKGTPRSEVD